MSIIISIVRMLLLTAVSVVFVSLILSNKDEITLSLYPVPVEYNLPIYLVIIFVFLSGFLLGGILSYGGALKHSIARKLEKSRNKNEISALKEENSVLKSRLVEVKKAKASKSQELIIS